MLGIRKRIQNQIARWVSNRLPPQRKIELSHRSIFIMPTRQGMLFIGFLGLLLIAAINYQNSLIYVLVFTLGSLMLLSIFNTFRNLSGVTLEFIGYEPCYKGEEAGYRLRVWSAKHRKHAAIYIGWQHDAMHLFSLEGDESETFFLRHPARQRGVERPGRLLVQTVYPFGLIQAWSWLDMATACLVYPAPRAHVASQSAQAEGEEEEHVGQILEGQDDFYGLREYKPGDALKHVAWKQFARRGELYTKEFHSESSDSEWVDWNHYPGVDAENRLSFMCHRVLELAEQNRPFGLRLPASRLEPQRGDMQKRACLKLIALYGLDNNETQALEF